ncbi:MAG: hypothetical protein ACI4D8_04665 [Wujia sp.]
MADGQGVNAVGLLRELVKKERKEIIYDEYTREMIYNETISINRELHLNESHFGGNNNG